MHREARGTIPHHMLSDPLLVQRLELPMALDQG